MAKYFCISSPAVCYDDLVQYYIDESGSYKQFAAEYKEFSQSETDVAFGLIVGTIYSTAILF